MLAWAAEAVRISGRPLLDVGPSHGAMFAELVAAGFGVVTLDPCRGALALKASPALLKISALKALQVKLPLPSLTHT